ARSTTRIRAARRRRLQTLGDCRDAGRDNGSDESAAPPRAASLAGGTESMTRELPCEEFAGRLADLLEREADETTRAALESHALACADCGALLADMRKLRIDAASLPVLVPSRDL